MGGRAIDKGSQTPESVCSLTAFWQYGGSACSLVAKDVVSSFVRVIPLVPESKDLLVGDRP